MSTVLICRDALEDSVLGNLALAQAFARQGDDVVVLFAGEALHALDTGTFEWSYNFKTRAVRSEIIEQAEAAGLPLADKDRDPRWSDVRGLVQHLAAESHVRVISCPIWSGLTGVNGGLGQIEQVDEAELVGLLRDADVVIGSY